MGLRRGGLVSIRRERRLRPLERWRTLLPRTVSFALALFEG